MEQSLTQRQKWMFLSYFVAQNSIWITSFGWMATYLVSRGITGPHDYLLISIIPAWGTFLGLISQPLYAPITDVAGSRWGRRRPYILIGGGFAALWFALIPCFTNYLWIIFIYGLCSLSLNLSEVAYMAFYRDRITLQSRGIISGGMLALSFFGALPLAVGVIGFEILGGPIFLSAPFLIGGIFTVLWTIPTVLLSDVPIRKATSFKERFRITIDGLRVLKTDIDFRRACIVKLLYSIASGIVVPFALLYLEQEIGIPTDIGGLINSLVLLVPFVFCIPLGLYADRRGRRPVMGLGGTSLLISMFVLFVNGFTLRSFPIAMVGFGFMGLSLTSLDFVTRIYVADISPEGKEAIYFATSNIFSTIPFPIGIFFGGLTGEVYQSLRYLPLLVILIAAILLVYVVLLRETVTAN